MRLKLAVLLVLGLVAGQSWSGEEDSKGRAEKVLTPAEAALGSKVKGGALVTIKVEERPLKQVLDYLSGISGINIRSLNEKTDQLLVTLNLENVSYRAVLDFIAKKYGLSVDDSQINDRLIVLNVPEKVSIVLQNADIRQVIETIAMQSGANIVVGPEVSGTVSMRLEDVPWKEALNIVVKTLDFVAVPEASDTIRITTNAKLAKQTETRIFRLSYSTPEGTKYTATLTSEFAVKTQSKEAGEAGTTLVDVLSKMKNPEGKLAFVKRNNALIVTDTATRLDAMQAVISKLDTAPKQVHVSVKIVAINDNDTERLGVSWGAGLQFQFTPVSNWPSAFPFDVTSGLSRSLLGDLAIGSAPRRAIDPVTNTVTSVNDIFNLRRTIASGGTATYSTPSTISLGSMGFGGTTALFEMLRTKTNSRIVQSPHLITLDNEQATIQVGRLIRYAESFVANTEGGGNVSGFREAAGSPIKEGLQLLIIPHVTGPENNILMTVIPKTEDLINFEEFIGPDGIVLRLPQTLQRIVVTNMLLRNGETGVIGGLRVDRDERTQNHVPVFSEIPILGRLFKHRTRTVSGESLMVFVTPTIVDLELRDDFKEQLDKLRSEMSKPFAPLGEDECAPKIERAGEKQ